MLRFIAVNKGTACAGILAVLAAGGCSAPKETTPPLTPQVAAALLQINPKSKNWLTRVKSEMPNCEYKIELPDQSAHPTVIDVERAITCGAAPAPRALNATVTYTYDKAAGRWVISRFAS